MKAKITRLPKAEKKLKEVMVPIKMPGKFIEDVLKEEGYVLQNGQGPDILELGIEVKSRCNTAISPNTVGAMSVEDIINTDYEDSHVAEKIQRQFRPIYDEYSRKVFDAKVVDFTDPFIQQKIKDAYEAGRKNLKEGVRGSYIKGTGWGNWEINRESPNSYIFRIPHKRMKDLVRMSTSSFNDLFE